MNVYSTFKNGEKVTCKKLDSLGDLEQNQNKFNHSTAESIKNIVDQLIELQLAVSSMKNDQVTNHLPKEENLVSKIHTLIHPPLCTIPLSSNSNDDLKKKLNDETDILKLIDTESNERIKRLKHVIIIGLNESSNDLINVKCIFNFLAIPQPIEIKRLYSKNDKFPRPVLCLLENIKNVQNLLKVSFKLRSNNKTENHWNESLNSKPNTIESNLIKDAQLSSTWSKYDQTKIPSDAGKSKTSPGSVRLNQPASKSSQNLNLSKTERTISNSDHTLQNKIKYSLKVYSSQDIDHTDDSVHISSSNQTIVKAYGINITQNDLHSLTTNACLNDQIINFYLNLLCNSFVSRKAYTLDSLISSKILSTDHRGLSKSLYKTNLTSFELLFIPLHVKGNHWALLVFDVVKKHILFMDSIYPVDILIVQRVASTLSKYLNVLKESSSWQIILDKVFPKQINNLTDCGVFICQYAKYLISDLPFDFSQKDIVLKHPKFQILHLNINSILNHLVDVDEILSSKLFDLVFFCETKLDDLIPNSFYNHDLYFKIRLDRSRHGGGLVVFIKNSLVVTKSILLDKLELIYFQIRLKNQKYNFVNSYRSPSVNEELFLDKLDDFIHTLNLNEPLFIIGDLNMDCLNNANLKIKDFIQNNDLINFVTKPTRISTKFYKKSNTTKKTTTLIDLLLHNGDLVENADVIDCPFSDHNFVVSKLSINKPTNVMRTIECRNLSTENMEKINNLIDVIDLKQLKNNSNIESKWTFFKNEILKIINDVAPLRKITVKNGHQFPWYDDDLLKLRHLKDSAYKRYIRSNLSSDKISFDHYNQLFKSTNDKKLIEYFKDKSLNDFRNSKKFWQFYPSKINVISDKSSTNPINHVKFNGKISNDKIELCNIFNRFFTTISSTSKSSLEDSLDFIDNSIPTMIGPEFKFSFPTSNELDDLIKTLPTSSAPGICGIPTKVLKLASPKLKSMIAYLFNYSILSCSIPKDWKTAIVTPLYKNKGSNDDVSNYRGISVLPPIAKLFEKLLHKQIISYLNDFNVLTGDQHGFRSNHSCESALHEILSEINKIRSKRLIGLLLFIDFKKAFYTVDAQILLLKLKKYGFSDTAINLIRNYFDNRVQVVKIDDFKSEPLDIRLGVPQGSVLGPLFFLLFINDLSKYLDNITVKLFADDTTIINCADNIEDLLSHFSLAIKKLILWCDLNRIDINWDKTKVMFVTNKKNVNIPEKLKIEGSEIEVVDNFKLLGITIDNKLNFLKYVSDLRNSINKRIYSIDRLFYLSHKVRLQFFKSFVLPYFDYCMTISIYFPKKAIQKLANTYYYCVHKLLHLNISITVAEDFNKLNIELNKFKLDGYQHKLIKRLTRFIYKIFNHNNAPTGLKNILQRNRDFKKLSFDLRNKNSFAIPAKGKLNDQMENTF
ncbi:unnamed protein product, partial [Brachionus calyciflorus]